jgi:hypothetical protein
MNAKKALPAGRPHPAIIFLMPLILDRSPVGLPFSSAGIPSPRGPHPAIPSLHAIAALRGPVETIVRPLH